MQIQRENVFDKSEGSSWLARATNGLHVVTRERVVKRELLIQEGEPFDSALAAESARNLRKLGIFREVSVDSVRNATGLQMHVSTHDSWTTQVYTSFKAGGDQITWGLGLTEKNLLGSQIKASVRYIDDPDRSTTQFGVSVPRVWRNKLGLQMTYQQLSDGIIGQFTASAPFTAATTPNALTFDFQYKDRSVLEFFEGESEASDTLRHLLTKAIATAGVALRSSPKAFVRLGTSFEVRLEDFTDAPIDHADRSFFAEFEASIQASRSKFVVVRGFRNLGGPEDIDLSTTVRMGVWVAPAVAGYDRFGIGPKFDAQTGATFKNGFVSALLKATSLFTSKGLDSGGVAVRTTLGLQPAPRHSIMLDADLGLQKNPNPAAVYDLGLTFGPRGFPAHAFTGDRAFFTTGEYRWVATPDLWGLFGLGLAAFVDYGGAWYAGSPKRTGTDVGVGLRIGSTRSSSGKGATRIDLTRRFANDVLDDEWVIAVGAGFPFDRSR